MDTLHCSLRSLVKVIAKVGTDPDDSDDVRLHNRSS